MRLGLIKNIAFSITTFLILSGSIISTASLEVKETSTLNTTGNTWIVDDEGDGDFTAIQPAIDNASNGDKIVVYSGVFKENLHLDKEIEMIGINFELGEGFDTGNPTIDGSGAGDVVSVTASNVKINGFVIQNSGTINDACIGIHYTHHVAIYENVLKNSSLGIHLSHCDSVQICINTITMNNWGILLEFTDNTTIFGNHVVKNNEYGIVLDFSPYNNINLNEIKNNEVGLISVRSSTCEINLNNFIDNYAIDATFKNSFNHWRGNFWSSWKKTIPIYIIWGIIQFAAFPNVKIYTVQIDQRPASNPYIIP